jgi:hypothetical protein
LEAASSPALPTTNNQQPTTTNRDRATIAIVKRLVLLLTLLAAVSVHADDDLINPDRPGIADGSATVGRGVFQIETGVDRDRESRAFPTLLRFGITKNFEARVESESALTHPILGFKFHFAGAPSLGVIARAGNQHQGDLRLAADVNLGTKWSLNPNVGVTRDRDGLAALTVQYNISDHANVFIDGGCEGSRILIDAGGAVILGRDTQLDVSVTRGARGTPAPNTVVSAGISRRF